MDIHDECLWKKKALSKKLSREETSISPIVLIEK